ncbi:MAG TPA: hypothetical protein VKA46_10250 [Gemmataceae bacterium]|nr:hypothetical protein [Gemmataceae bacterium]
MSLGSCVVVAAVVVGACLATAQPADAARLRYHFAPDPGGNGCLKTPSAGERLTLTGWEPYNCPPPRATQLVSFRHPCTGQTVTVPLALPLSTPRMEYTRERVIYNYGSDTVELRFQKDGSADVMYDSGLLRAP